MDSVCCPAALVDGQQNDFSISMALEIDLQLCKKTVNYLDLAITWRARRTTYTPFTQNQSIIDAVSEQVTA